MLNDATIRLGKLQGVNQVRVGRLPNELADCLNVIGEASGFSVWGGQNRYSKASLGQNWALYQVTWPDEHESFVVVSRNGIYAEEIGEFHFITGEDRIDLQFRRAGSSDFRNPVHFTRFQYGNYIVGSLHQRQTPFYWDGNIDHDVGSVTVPDDISFRVVETFAGRLWGLGSEQHPLQIFYGDLNELEIEAGQFLSFLDNPNASRIVGMRAAARNYAFVWGDRGLWAVEHTGSYPLFVSPQLISADCDCVSNNSIVSIPGGGYAWMGREGVWMLDGGKVRRIDVSHDTSTAAYLRSDVDGRTAYRLKDEFDRIPINSQYLCAGFWHRARGIAVWSYPTKECIEQHEWQSPRSICWKPVDNSWWLLDTGWQSVAETVHRNRRLPVGTSQDGYLYLIDSNIDYEKISEPLPWHIETEWLGDPAAKAKWTAAVLERPFSGTDKVMVKFWTRYQASAPVTDSFSLDEAYDDASRKKWSYLSADAAIGDSSITVDDAAGWGSQETRTTPTCYDVTCGFVRIGDSENHRFEREGNELTLCTRDDDGNRVLSPLVASYDADDEVKVEIKDLDPGGPNDGGISPDPVAVCRIPVRLVGPQIKVRLSNYDEDNDTYFNGPRIPCSSLTLMARPLGQ